MKFPIQDGPTNPVNKLNFRLESTPTVAIFSSNLSPVKTSQVKLDCVEGRDIDASLRVSGSHSVGCRTK